MKNPRIFGCVLAMLAGIACGPAGAPGGGGGGGSGGIGDGGGGGSGGGEPVPVSIAIAPAEPVLEVGQTERLLAEAQYSDLSTADVTASVTWESLDPVVATVSGAPGAEGTVTAVAAGVARIQASMGPVTRIAHVQVTSPPSPRLVSIAVTPAETTLIGIGTTLQYSAVGTYSSGPARDLTAEVEWSVEDYGVARFLDPPAAKGMLSGKREGDTSVVARLDGVRGEAIVHVQLVGGTGPITFTSPPLDIAAIQEGTALGNLSPPMHTLPSPHISFYPKDRMGTYPVYVPGDGVIYRLLPLGDGRDYGVYMAHTQTFRSYFGHVARLDPAILAAAGPLVTGRVNDVYIPVTAGQSLGFAGEGAGALDFGIRNFERRLTGFIDPERWYGDAVFADAAIKYYTGQLQQDLYATVDRVGPDKDGKIDFDVPGFLVGGWFWEHASGPYDWESQLGFVYDFVDPSQVRITSGGKLGQVGAYAIDPGDPLPAMVDEASGKVAYRLHTWHIDTREPVGPQVGLLIARLVAPDRLEVQLFPGSTASDAEFDERALFYTR